MPSLRNPLLLHRKSKPRNLPLLGDGKEQRKIPVLNLQAIDVPIKCDHVLRGDSKSFPGPFLHNPNKISGFDSPTRL
jgi:hypothetical protein